MPRARSSTALFVAGAGAMLVAGCAPPGKPSAPAPVERVATYVGSAAYAVYEGVPPAEVQARPATLLPAVREAYRAFFPESGVEPGDGGQVGVHGVSLTRRLATAPLATYLDCGTSSTGGPLANDSRVTASFVTVLRPAGDGSRSVVATRIDAVAAPLEAGMGRSAVRCATTGVFEAEVLAHARDVLSARTLTDGDAPREGAPPIGPPATLSTRPRGLSRVADAASVTTGSHVRIRTGNRTFPARVAGVSASGMTARVEGGLTSIPWPEVEQLEVRVQERSRARMGAVLGALGGLAAGLGSDLFIDGKHAAQGRLLNPGLGALTGGLAGALLGSLIRSHRWERLW